MTLCHWFIGSEISKVKVIDMTGPEQRVLSGYSALSVKKTSEPMDSEATSQTLSARDKLQLDKLAYNLDALVDFCEHVRSILLNLSMENKKLIVYCRCVGNYWK